MGRQVQHRQEAVAIGPIQRHGAAGLGRAAGELRFAELEAYVHRNGEPEKRSGREEMLENIINSFI